jgi:hypothetical protein
MTGLAPALFSCKDNPGEMGAMFEGAGPMKREQAHALARMVRAQEVLENRREAELRAIAHGLIQNHIGRNRRITHIQIFYTALVQALIGARAQAKMDCGEDVLTLT